MNLPPIQIDSEDADKVVVLNTPFKKQAPEDRVLLVQTNRCFHINGFILHESLEHVECKACHEKLNPMWVLCRLANKETQYHMAAERYQEEMRRLSERSRTKCEHCQKMTRIRRS